MGKFFKIVSLTVLTLITFALRAESAKIVQLQEIRVEELAGKTRVALISAGPVDYTCFTLDSPPRLIINFVDDNVYTKESEKLIVNRGLVKEIRSQRKEKEGKLTAYLDYLVLELSQPSSFSTEREANSIIVDLKPVTLASPGPKVVKKTPISIEEKEKTIGNLEECLRIALANSKTLMIAKEEIGLAELKVREATRGLYPSLMGKLDRTDGKIRTTEPEGVDAGFRETEFGLQVGQSVYQGGKLKSTLAQARASLDMAKKKYDKAKQEVIFEAKKAYYNLVSSQANLYEHDTLLRQAESILEEAKKKHEMNLVTNEELLNVQSQYNQAYYQKISQEKGQALALLTLKHLLNVEESISVEAETHLDFQDLGISLDNCLELAGKNSLDLALSRLSVKFADFGREIAKSDQGLKIDISGFYGRGGGAYKTEKLKISDSWYAGIKVSKALGGNTLSSGYTSDQTNPKLGQSSRTESNTGSVTLSFLDNLKNQSEEKRAEIEYERATNELKETEEKVELEVKEAYFNYEKSLVQLEAISKEIEFRKEETRIAREKGKMNLVSNSQVLGTEINLTNAQTSYNEALAYYHIALASLNKAMGIEEYK